MIAIKKIWPLCMIILLLASCNNKVHLFTSFNEPATAGLKLLYSKDGYQWKSLDTVLLTPQIGKSGIMRDPSIVQGPDGWFHLVFTTEWKGGNGFGYAASKDLINWTSQQYLPLMQHEPTVVNIWAPEIFYDDVQQQFIIIWASTIPNRFEKGIEAEDNNHRMYYTTTKDFKQFSATKLYLDPGFSVIDAVIVKRKKDDYVLVLKDNTRPQRNLKVAFSKSPFGPWENISAPFTEVLTEGPSVLPTKDGWLIYFDSYGQKNYDAVFTNNFIDFKPMGQQIGVPAAHKHGTIISVKPRYLKKLIDRFKK